MKSPSKMVELLTRAIISCIGGFGLSHLQGCVTTWKRCRRWKREHTSAFGKMPPIITAYMICRAKCGIVKPTKRDMPYGRRAFENCSLPTGRRKLTYCKRSIDLLLRFIDGRFCRAPRRKLRALLSVVTAAEALHFSGLLERSGSVWSGGITKNRATASDSSPNMEWPRKIIFQCLLNT